MTKILVRILLFPCFILGTYLIIFLVPTKSDLVFTSILDKHNRLENTPSLKVIFVGGSNLALGLDSKLIQEEIDLPVINMGLNGGLGLRYMLSEIKPYIHENDIIVITPEYSNFYGNLNGGLNLWWIVEIMPKSIDYLSTVQYFMLAKNLPIFMQQRAKEILDFEQDPVYNRHAFNQYGDFVNHLGLEPKKNLGGIGRISGRDFDPEAIQITKAFVEFANDRGATVFYIFPPLAEVQYELEDNRAAITQVYDKLQGIPNLYVVSTPDNYVFPNYLFFDTVYHLTSEGREIRSENITNNLQIILKKKDTQLIHTVAQ